MAKVKVSEGVLAGKKEEINEFGGKFYSFKGIPYAEPPIGDLRFKAPQPAKPWTGIRNATEHGPISYQYDMFITQQTQGSEDCLYLNIYTPELKPRKPLPVMVWIHGGGLTSGSGNDDLYGPDILVRHSVILVTINYRLDIVGFLCLHTEDVPGNAGMKDQVAALRWIKKNINHFGGDPENITIFGESAGGASASYHCISPMSKGLFKRAILQSGCFTSWLPNIFLPRERSLILAKELGCESKNNTEIYDFLKRQPIENLVNKQINLSFAESIKLQPNISFGVVVEKKFDNIEPFLSENIYKLLQNGLHEGIEVMNGYTADEGIIFLAGDRKVDTIFEQANKFLEFFVPKQIEIQHSISHQLNIGKKFKNFYFQNNKICQDNLDQLFKYISMAYFIYPAITFQKAVAKLNKNKLYLYKFSCKSELNMFTEFLGLTDMFKGDIKVSHADDIFYLFPLKKTPQNFKITSKALKMIEKVSRLWTNFAKFGDPTPDNSFEAFWKPYTMEGGHYMDISDVLIPGVDPDKEEVEFWNDIYKELYPQISF